MEPMGIKVIDCIMFHNEVEMLDLRLHEMDCVVDHFVIVECNKTFSGTDKPLMFEKIKHRFEPFLSKIVHIVVDDTPETDEPWVRERYQRDSSARAFAKINPDQNDVVIISDCDEIIDVETVKKYKEENVQGIHALQQDFYYYNLNCKFDIKWYHPKIMRYKNLLECNNDFSNIRLSVRPVIERGGWHFSYFGDTNFIINKIKDGAHQEYNNDYYTSESFILDCVKNKKRIAGEGNVVFTEVSQNDYLPKHYKKIEFVKNNRMKISHVSPGLISIPPNGWGAIEKIIWNYKLQLEKLNHSVDIKFVNQIDKSDDILHIHVANLAIEAAKLGIPYVFSLHDHHVVHYGVGSYNYNINLEAIKKSVISITHAEYLVDHFPDTDKLFYLPHGADTEFFKPDGTKKTEHKLLCLANNGLAGDPSFDRKGFLFAIDAARELGLPITVAGPIDNVEFFKHHPDHASYEKLTLRCDSPTEEQILELYRDHTVFLHPSMLEAGHPNLTMLEALSCGLPVVGTYKGTKKIEGLFVVDRDVKSIVESVIHVMTNYVDITEKIQQSIKQHDWSRIVERLEKMYKSVKSIRGNVSNEEAKYAYLNAYNSAKKRHVKPVESFDVNIHFVDGPFLEIKGNTGKKYKVQFLDEQGNLHFEDTIGCNMWVRLNRKYFTKWKINVYEGDLLVYSKNMSLENERVLIGLDSKSLGDTLAWFPYVEEFRKKHNCKIIASTFHNHFFKNTYPEIEFVEPGTVVHSIMAKYDIGWFYDNDKEPELPNTIPLQKTATNILGLPYEEIIPNIDFVAEKRPYDEKYVVIATASTSGLKYWTKEGWQEVVNYLKSEGYRVIHVSKEGTDLDVEQLSDTSMENTMNVLHHAEFLVGLSSGLSWLAWALRKKVVMISNFTEADHEFQTDCLRITDTRVCHGCWNKSEFKFDKGDWNWCPKHKNTDRHFECHRSIKAQTVIDRIKTLL